MDHGYRSESMYHDLPRNNKRKPERGDSKALKKSKCRASKSKWTQEEDEILTRAVSVNGEGNWKKIAQSLGERSHLQCLHRWQKVLNPALVKGPWKEEEDLKLVELVEKYGPKDWSTIASHIQGRIGKQCRERWFNHLSPDVRKTNWTAEEDQIIIDAHNRMGNKWTAISKLLDGRPANAIKNHWNSTLLKRIQQSDAHCGSQAPPRRERSKVKKFSIVHPHLNSNVYVPDQEQDFDQDQDPDEDQDDEDEEDEGSPFVSDQDQSPTIEQKDETQSKTLAAKLQMAQAHPIQPAALPPYPLSLDPTLVLFGDHSLAWDFPPLAGGAMAVTVGGMGGLSSLGSLGSPSEMGGSFGSGFGPDLMDLYTPEVQYFQPVMTQCNQYSPMSVEANMNMNLNMSMLNFDCFPLQLSDI